jgi:hypothetical protein
MTFQSDKLAISGNGMVYSDPFVGFEYARLEKDEVHILRRRTTASLMLTAAWYSEIGCLPHDNYEVHLGQKEGLAWAKWSRNDTYPITNDGIHLICQVW